jgi:pyruvate formate lyase activating enzyme
VLPEKIQKIKDSFIDKETVFNFLEQREGLLDGVVISGGEPTVMPDLVEFMGEIRKRFDYQIKLDSNGNKPDVLREVVDKGLVDYMAMDIKTDLKHYESLVGGRANPDKLRESVEFLKEGRVEYEFRSTIIKGVHARQNFEAMADLMKGAEVLYLQRYNPGHTLDPDFASFSAFSKDEMANIAGIFEGCVKRVEIRG